MQFARIIRCKVFVLALVCATAAYAMPVFKGVVVSPGTPALTESADNTTIQSASDAPIVDSALVTWTVQGLPSSGVVYRNGQTAAFTAQVTLLLYHSDTIYQRNSAGNWWSWNGSDWTAEPSGDPRGAVPVINSSPSAIGTVGVSFSYTPTATNSPTSWTQSGKPSWASFNTSTGALTGTPDAAASSTITLTASNATGTSANFSLNVSISATATDRIVIAHWMGTLGKNANNLRSQSDFEDVLVEMAATNIDALALFWSADTDDGTSGGHPIDDVNDVALAAAVATGTKVTIAQYGDRYDDLLHFGTQAGVYKDSSNRVVWTGFNSVLDILNDPQDKVFQDQGDLAAVAAAIGPNYFWPDAVPYSPTQTKAQRVALLTANCGQPVGLFEWFPGPQTPFGGAVYDMDDWETYMDAAYADAGNYNVPMMVAINCNYVANPNQNSQMFDADGFRGLRRQYDWAREKPTDRVVGLQIVTVNDKDEHHYIQTYGDGSTVVGAPGHDIYCQSLILDHSGFRKFDARENLWFKTGVEPTVSTNQFLICYRLHPRTAESFSSLPSGTQTSLINTWLPNGRPSSYFTLEFQRLSTHDIFSDTIQACIRLKAADLPAHATLTCGSTTTGSIAITDPETIIVLNGDSSASVHSRTKYIYANSQINATPHLHVTKDADSSVLKDADGPLPITPYIIPGGYNMLATEL